MLSRIMLCALTLSVVVSADTLITRDGRTIRGTYLGGDARRVRITVGDRVESFDISNIQEIRFGDDAPVPQAEMAPPPPPPAPKQHVEIMRPEREYNTETPPPPRQSDAQSASTQQDGRIEVPAGTNIVVRMIDAVDSEKASLGQTFRANVDEPVTIDGQVVIPRGSDVVAKLVEDKQSGKFEGRTVLTLDLQSLTVNGRTIDLTTQSVSQASESRTSRTGKLVGGGTALGAIIGAIAGGGKGAAIGAVSGAAAGAGAQVLTKGQKVHIPSETRLSFILQQPAYI